MPESVEPVKIGQTVLNERYEPVVDRECGRFPRNVGDMGFNHCRGACLRLEGMLAHVLGDACGFERQLLQIHVLVSPVC